MPAHKKELSLRMRYAVSGLACLLMASVLFIAAFPSGVHLTRLDHIRHSGQVTMKTADAGPRF